MNNLKQYLLLSFILLSFVACQNNTTTPPITTIDSTTTTVPAPPSIIPIQGNPVPLVVTTQQAIIRAEPSLDAAEIARYVKGDSLLFTNRISNFNTAIKIEGIPYNEPWLRIIIEGNKMGWIYGGCINFDATQQIQLKEKVLDQRAVALFGRSLAQQIAIYQKEVQSTTTLPGFRSLYSRAELIKDSLEQKIAIHLQTSSATELPNFFWLNELMTGLLVHYIPEQDQYYLFRDLKLWQQISLKSESQEDDAFMETLLASYSSDSIAFHYYGWQLPTDSNTMCSLLGSNIHKNVLEKMELALDSNGYFREELLHIKEALINDISISNHYWLPLESIQTELDKIIQRSYNFFTVSDRVALKTRRQMIQNYRKNDIAINLFEGQ